MSEACRVERRHGRRLTNRIRSLARIGKRDQTKQQYVNKELHCRGHLTKLTSGPGNSGCQIQPITA